MFHPEYIARQNVARVVLKLFIAMTMKMMLLQGIKKEYPIRAFDIIIFLFIQQGGYPNLI